MSIDLASLLSLGESETLEFKKSLAERDAALVDLCGMLNTERATGRVLFGVGPDSAPVGIDPGNLDKAQRSVAQAIATGFEPAVTPEIRVIPQTGVTILSLQASRPKVVPYFEFSGVAYIRVGTVTRRLSLAEKQRLGRVRNRDSHMGPWRCSGCGSIAGQISAIVVTDRGVQRTYSHGCGGEWWPAT